MKEDYKYEKGIVKGFHDSIVIVERTNIGSCKSCSIGSFCVMKDKSEIAVESTDEFSIGDVVDLMINPAVRVWSALLIFILPVLFLVSIYPLSYYIFRFTEGWSILISLICSSLSLLIVKIINNKYGKKFNIRIQNITGLLRSSQRQSGTREV